MQSLPKLYSPCPIAPGGPEPAAPATSFPPRPQRLADWYGERAQAVATRRAYSADMRAWERWLQHRGLDAQTARVEHAAEWIASRGWTCTVSTLRRAVAGCRAEARRRGWPCPFSDRAGRIHPRIAQTLAGVGRVHGDAPRRAAPLMANDFQCLMHAIQPGDPSALRDRALLAVGWHGALRRAELCGLEWRDVHAAIGGGVELHVRASKGERAGGVATVLLVPAISPRCCAVQSLSNWRAAARGRAGRPGAKVFTAPGRAALAPHAVTAILRRRARAAGLPVTGVSAHSLRAGMLTSAALAGADPHRLRRHSRHSRSDTLDGYIRPVLDVGDHPGRGLV